MVVVAVLGNDDGVDFATATVNVASSPDDGLAVVVGLVIHYLPDDDFNGIDTFTYRVCSPPGLCDTGTVTVTVLPVNDPPVARPDTAAASVGQPETVAVLGNDSDVDGDALAIVSFDLVTALGGTVVLDTRGTSDPSDDRLVYTSSLFWNTAINDTFAYVVGDGRGGLATAVVTITG